MWHIHDIKKTAKTKMYASYWKSVLTALILALVTGGFAAGSSASASTRIETQIGNGAASYEWYGRDLMTGPFWNFHLPFAQTWILYLVLGILLLFVLSGLALSIFLLNPLESGCQRFFIVNHVETGRTKLGEIFHGFSSQYLNVVKTMFLRDLYLFLWTLLFVIPGIVKSYSYRLVPYILAEEPGMNSKEAFRLSRAMMDGNKWHAFLLDLSFIGWNILNVFTLGILGIFYVSPYRATANAEMYIALRDQYLGTANTTP